MNDMAVVSTGSPPAVNSRSVLARRELWPVMDDSRTTAATEQLGLPKLLALFLIPGAL